MPVHDHDIHPMTQFGDDYRYGCHSDRRAIMPPSGYWVKVRKYADDGTFEMVDQFIPNVMSVFCRYDKSQNDLNCRGCKNESDMLYLKGYGLTR